MPEKVKLYESWMKLPENHDFNLDNLLIVNSNQGRLVLCEVFKVFDPTSDPVIKYEPKYLKNNEKK